MSWLYLWHKELNTRPKRNNGVAHYTKASLLWKKNEGSQPCMRYSTTAEQRTFQIQTQGTLSIPAQHSRMGGKWWSTEWDSFQTGELPEVEQWAPGFLLSWTVTHWGGPGSSGWPASTQQPAASGTLIPGGLLTDSVDLELSIQECHHLVYVSYPTRPPLLRRLLYCHGYRLRSTSHSLQNHRMHNFGKAMIFICW